MSEVQILPKLGIQPVFFWLSTTQVRLSLTPESLPTAVPSANSICDSHLLQDQSPSPPGSPGDPAGLACPSLPPSSPCSLGFSIQAILLNHIRLYLAPQPLHTSSPRRKVEGMYFLPHRPQLRAYGAGAGGARRLCTCPASGPCT